MTGTRFQCQFIWWFIIDEWVTNPDTGLQWLIAKPEIRFQMLEPIKKRRECISKDAVSNMS